MNHSFCYQPPLNTSISYNTQSFDPQINNQNIYYKYQQNPISLYSNINVATENSCSFIPSSQKTTQNLNINVNSNLERVYNKCFQIKNNKCLTYFMESEIKPNQIWYQNQFQNFNYDKNINYLPNSNEFYSEKNNMNWPNKADQPNSPIILLNNQRHFLNQNINVKGDINSINNYNYYNYNNNLFDNKKIIPTATLPYRYSNYIPNSECITLSYQSSFLNNSTKTNNKKTDFKILFEEQYMDGNVHTNTRLTNNKKLFNPKTPIKIIATCSPKWKPKDDKLLRELKEIKNLSWKDISLYFPTRTLNACQFRWRRLIDREKNKTKIKKVKVKKTKR